ncbi:MAG: MBL fold metallo-hydrolase [Verrucomicrobiota bacterium]|nr:MBL fold metallo-hydrolase [Verrucomicrobiota bacterium]
MKLCVLGSGSTGNCVYAASETTHILIDAGLSAAETIRRLESIGAPARDIGAVCVTHEHADHVDGLAALHRRIRAPLYANAGTIEALEKNPKLQRLPWNVFATGHPFRVGTLRMAPFSVPHDSYDPVGFVVSREDAGAEPAVARIGVMTDAGMATELIRTRLRGCRAVALEANHDLDLLRESPRPWGLKQRIASRQGHLSNAQAAELIAEIAGPELKVVFLAHLSGECNRPELAVGAVTRMLEAKGILGVEVKLTYPDRPSEVAEC